MVTTDWIRGVNLGGWLVLERFITPYLFAITSCHVEGNFCWYPNQIDAPPEPSPEYKVCDLYKCKPVLDKRLTGNVEYPIDEYTLMDSFQDKTIARRFMEFHWEHFITEEDIATLAHAGVSHVRVPIPHWIMGDIVEDEPWVDGGWMYFVRLVSWCRMHNIQVWPDLHTAPGSQNGFDNSGQFLGIPTSKGWSDSPSNMKRTLKALQDILFAVKRDGLADVVTGVGILNEPFKDCPLSVAKDYNTQALHLVRTVLGNDTYVYMGDLFNATMWNDGDWWTNESSTLLDSHYYHVFDGKPRHLSPRQHVALVCQKQDRDTNSCCYKTNDGQPSSSKGISRLVGEWSGAFDTLVSAQLDLVMKSIQENGIAYGMNRQLSSERKGFLSDFVKAQMVTYESTNAISKGWFYWTLKTEGGAFAEWDFMRGIKEGWIPSPIPPKNVSSKSLYGTCYDILRQTDDDMTIVHEYPDPKDANNYWQGPDLDDDVVVSHGESVLDSVGSSSSSSSSNGSTAMPSQPVTYENGMDMKSTDNHNSNNNGIGTTHKSHHSLFTTLVAIAFFGGAVYQVFFKNRFKRQEYTEVFHRESQHLYV